MGRIKIDDFPEEQKINKEVMRKVMGGGYWDDLTSQSLFDLPTSLTQYNQVLTARSNIYKKQNDSTTSSIKNIG